jgi:hypothetical protein
MGNLSFEHVRRGWKEATRWLSLSPDTFKPGLAQLSITARVIPGRVKDANPESRGY